MDNLDKLDLIRERLNVSFTRANDALQEAKGDVIEAILNLEQELKQEKRESQEETMDREEEFEFDKGIAGENIETIRVKSQELMDRIKQLIKEGNVNKISVKNDERTLVEIPVNAGVVSLVLFPYITVLAGLGAMFKEYKLEINKDNVKVE